MPEKDVLHKNQWMEGPPISDIGYENDEANRWKKSKNGGTYSDNGNHSKHVQNQARVGRDVGRVEPRTS